MKSPRLRSLALLLLVLQPLLVHAAAPVNDTFANAINFTATAATVRLQNGGAATADKYDPYIAGVKPAKTLWYRFDNAYNSINPTNHVILNHPGTGARFGVFVRMRTAAPAASPKWASRAATHPAPTH